MTIEEQINSLYIQEKNRVFDKEIPGFYHTQAEYEGTSVYDEI